MVEDGLWKLEVSGWIGSASQLPGGQELHRRVRVLANETFKVSVVRREVLIDSPCRWTPSQGDVVVFNALSGSPDGKFVHVLRWYNQIASYQKSEWPW